MADNGGKKVTFEPGVIARVAAGVRYAMTGKEPDWFGPKAPLDPVAPPDVAGRQNDYITGVNINTRPRSHEPVSFEQMRVLADSCDIVRLVIESRKDQLCAQEFTFKIKGDQGSDDDPRIEKLKEFFAMPDREHTWSEWLRLLLEDLFVIDAPTVYIRKTVGGELFSLEPIDGSTIKRVIDYYGRTPLDGVAYQQVLKGLPAIDYTREELIYKPRNVRTNKMYGYSPVEQIILTLNMAIRRQLQQLSYFTHGSTPDLIMTVPSEWNPDQIARFRDIWNEVLEGNLNKRAGTQFVPDGVNAINTKDQILKDTFDEWLARVVCYAFSVSPQPFVKDQNRATADTAKETALQEGLLPLMKWVKELIDSVIVRCFGFTDIEFRWSMDEELDALTKAQVSQIYVAAKVLTADEVRERDLALPPLTPEQKEELTPPPPPMLPAPGGNNGGDDEPPKKPQAPTTKAHKIKPINRDRQQVTRPKNQMASALKKAFAATVNAIAGSYRKGSRATDLAKGDPKKPDFNLDHLDTLNDVLEPALALAAVAGVDAAADQIGVSLDKKINQMAIDYARARAAELVGKRIDADGNIVDNPRAEYSISEATRDGIRSIVAQAEEEGWAKGKLKTALKESYFFSDERAETIARTEVAFADSAGNMIAYRESGVVSGKQWLLAPDSCDICVENEAAGVIPLDENFPDGSDTAPSHPNCVCDVIPVIGED